MADHARKGVRIAVDGVACFALRRGAQRMVVFRGCPSNSTTDSLHEGGAMVGLAITPNELNDAESIGAYDYVFVGQETRTASLLDNALRDLVSDNWYSDESPAADTASTRLNNGKE